MGDQERRLSTGDEHLDRHVDGGLPTGDLLALTAPPESQSHLLLSQFAEARPTRFVVTDGTPPAKARDRYEPDGEETAVTCENPSELLASPSRLADAVPPEGYLVVDAADPLERAEDPSEFLELLSALEQRLLDVDAVGVLHCLGGSDPYRRSETLHRADQVWQLVPKFTPRQIGYQLLVTKARGSRAADEPLPVVLTDAVTVDTSWSI